METVSAAKGQWDLGTPIRGDLEFQKQKSSTRGVKFYKFPSFFIGNPLFFSINPLWHCKSDPYHTIF